MPTLMPMPVPMLIPCSSLIPPVPLSRRLLGVDLGVLLLRPAREGVWLGLRPDDCCVRALYELLSVGVMGGGGKSEFVVKLL
jgi:hypothetical protein